MMIFYRIKFEFCSRQSKIYLSALNFTISTTLTWHKCQGLEKKYIQEVDLVTELETSETVRNACVVLACSMQKKYDFSNANYKSLFYEKVINTHYLVSFQHSNAILCIMHTTCKCGFFFSFLKMKNIYCISNFDNGISLPLIITNSAKKRFRNTYSYNSL